MRLLYLNHNYRFGGTFYRAMPMAEQLANRGHQVTLLCVSRQHRWQVAWSLVHGVLVGEMPNLAFGDTAEGYGILDNFLRLAHAAKKRYDIVHMFDHKPNASFAGWLARWRGARLVADWADWWTGIGDPLYEPKHRFAMIGRFEAWWEVRQKQKADGVITISTALRQRALDIGCSPDRVVYIPTGAPTGRIRPVSLATARRQLNVPEDRRIVGFIGIGQSDLEIVMRALQTLPDVWLMIIGPYRQRILDMATTFGLANRVWQTDIVSDQIVSKYLGCADLFCLPLSDNNVNRGRFPNKLLDYLAAGRPTIASPVGDVKKIFQENSVGLLAGDYAFSDAIRQLLADTDMSVRLGRNARVAAETVFAWGPLIDQIEVLYRKLLNS